jgi:hypothetical protein
MSGGVYLVDGGKWAASDRQVRLRVSEAPGRGGCNGRRRSGSGSSGPARRVYGVVKSWRVIVDATEGATDLLIWRAGRVDATGHGPTTVSSSRPLANTQHTQHPPPQQHCSRLARSTCRPKTHRSSSIRPWCRGQPPWCIPSRGCYGRTGAIRSETSGLDGERVARESCMQPWVALLSAPVPNSNALAPTAAKCCQGPAWDLVVDGGWLMADGSWLMAHAPTVP